MPKNNSVNVSVPVKSNKVFWLALFAFFCAFVYILRSVLLPFVAGIIIGYLLDPLVDKFTRLKIGRTWSTVLVLVLVVLIIVPAFVLLVNVIDSQLSVFISVIPNYVSSLLKKAEPLLIDLKDMFPALDADKIRSYMHDNMANNLKILGKILRSVISGGMAIVNLISLLLITPVVAFYMLRDWDKFIAKVRSLLPRKSKKSIEQQARDVHAPDDPRYRREAVRQWVAHVPARFREQRFEAQDADGHVVIQLTTFHVRSFSVGIRRAACRMGIREKPFPPGAIPAPFPRLFLPGANLWTESAEGKAVGDGGWGDRLGGGFWGKSAAPPLNRIFPVSFSCSFPQSTGRCR